MWNVKRVNATRKIQSNSHDFEAELKVLCKAHHAHLVNLLGYYEEMGEWLLVYEFMPHGTLHGHLHGGLVKVSWNLWLKVANQAAQGIEYLHKDASPKIIQRYQVFKGHPARWNVGNLGCRLWFSSV
ncbi:hypothetical protein R1flu_015379 [Riccia fluitans]|uniref:Protein kinase domain-containing protein n=1 Tax=Riccia fluitans TaxID=41844 RepID=A0ABD1YIR6_9MARC